MAAPPGVRPITVRTSSAITAPTPTAVRHAPSTHRSAHGRTSSTESVAALTAPTNSTSVGTTVTPRKIRSVVGPWPASPPSRRPLSRIISPSSSAAARANAGRRAPSSAHARMMSIAWPEVIGIRKAAANSRARISRFSRIAGTPQARSAPTSNPRAMTTAEATISAATASPR